MAESVTEEGSVRGYVSCIKINGKPILPPMMTPERWVEMKRYKEMAILIEASLNMKRNSVDSGVICPSSLSSSVVNRKPVDITEITSTNIHLSTSDEEALFCELEQNCTSAIAVHDSKKHHDMKISTVSNNAKSCNRENVQESQFTLRCVSPVDVNVSEVHQATIQGNTITQEVDKINTGPADVSKTIPPSKGIVYKGSLPYSENENLLHQCTVEQNQQIGAKHVSPRTTGSVLPPPCPQDVVNFGTISPGHDPVNQITTPIAESSTSTTYSSHSGDEARISVKKVHASLNVSEIIAQDDIIQDGLGFKVWKHGCEVLIRRSQHSSTPADTVEENLSNIETNRAENLDESESSIGASASTDLNNYMNTSDSSKSPASVQSLNFIVPAVHKSEIAKQTTHDNQQSSSSDQSKHQQGETEAHASFNKSIPESQLQNNAENFDIDGIRPLNLKHKVEQQSVTGVGVIKSSTASEVGTVKKLEDHVKQKTAVCIERNESRTSSDSPPPRLKRQNSYVLECPSPLLVEYYKSLKHDRDMTASPTKKILSTLENQQEVQRHRLSGSEFNSSLPSTSVSSPVKLQSPFASSECLSSTKENLRTSNTAMSKPIRKSYSSSKDNLKKSRCISSETLRRLSADETYPRGKKNAQKIPLAHSPRYGSVDDTSIGLLRKSTNAMKCPKTPYKTPRVSSASLQNLSPRNSVKQVACVSRNRSTESLVEGPTPSGTPEKLSAQEELRAVFLQLQIEHQQQMADLLKKQEREQEAMREAFRQQQVKLMTEIRSICPEVFSTPESHKLLAKSITQPLNTNIAVGLQGIDHNKKPASKSPLENMTGDLQESTRQKEPNRKVGKNFENNKMKNDNDSSGSHYWDEVSFSEVQSMNTSTSEVAETLISSNLNPSQEACQNQTNSPLASGHLDSPGHKNTAALCTKENAIQQLQNIHNSTALSDIETIARENINFASEISSNKSDLSRSITTESSVSVEHSDSIVTSGASGSRMTQQMLYGVHANGTVISKIHHLDEVSLSSVQSFSTNTSDVAEISKQVYRSKPSLSETTGDMIADTALTSVVPDLDENTAMQQALYGLQTDGKIVSSMLTVAKSEVILSDGLPYLEPREGTVRTTVFTQLNGVDHNSLVNTHISTVMHGTRQSCSRELFPALSRFGNYTKTHERAATRIQAVIRGYLTRRLFRTARVQDLITTIRDTLLCAVQVSQECWPDVRPEDVELHRRLIQQVTAACYALHDVFFSLPISDQMVIIAADREKQQRSQASRTSLQQPLSAATRRVLERKMKQSENEGKPRTARGRRTWSSGCDNPSGSYGMARSCLLRQQQQQMSPPEQMVVRGRYSSTSFQRRPWR